MRTAWPPSRRSSLDGTQVERLIYICDCVRPTTPRQLGGSNTTQLFFPQDVIDTINTTISPYNAEGANPTTNASDHVYSGEVGGGTLLTLSGDNTNGYTATFKVNLPITAL